MIKYKVIDFATLETYTIEIQLGCNRSYRVLDKLDQEIHGVEHIQINHYPTYTKIQLTINGAPYNMDLITCQHVTK